MRHYSKLGDHDLWVKCLPHKKKKHENKYIPAYFQLNFAQSLKKCFKKIAHWADKFSSYVLGEMILIICN